MVRRQGRKQQDLAKVPPNDVEPSILTLRGQKVLLDRDVAAIYGTTVGVLNQAVKRNKGRFPIDFMFRLSWDETRLVSALRSQNVILKRGGHLKFRPNAFTEHGAVMLAAILNSPVAVAASIQVVRTFVRLRQVLSSHEGFRAKLEAIEKRLEDHDEKFGAVFEAIRALMDTDEEEAKRPRIGYETEGLQRGGLSYTTVARRKPVGRVAGFPLHG